MLLWRDFESVPCLASFSLLDWIFSPSLLRSLQEAVDLVKAIICNYILAQQSWTSDWHSHGQGQALQDLKHERDGSGLQIYRTP